MEKFSETQDPLRSERVDHLNMRWEQLYELETNWGEKCVRYLLMVNSGGAIATLSFLGTSSQTLTSIEIKSALFLFLVGIVLVGTVNARQFYRIHYLFDKYRKGVEKYFDDSISWRQLRELDENGVDDNRLDFAIPWFSFGCFVLGCLAGACALFS